MSQREMVYSRWRQRFSVLLPLAASIALCGVSGCAAGEMNSSATAGPSRPLYRPGQSLDARLCECRECFARACCSGEPESSETDGQGEDDGEPELGISLTACGRCVRRTWTVRGSDACSALAPAECCPGSIAN